MRTIIRWLKPTRLDRYLFILAGLFFFALVGWDMVGGASVSPGTVPKSLTLWLVAPYLIAVFGIAATIGVYGLKSVRQRALFLFLVQVITVVFGWVIVQKNRLNEILADCFSTEYLKSNLTVLDLGWANALIFLLAFEFVLLSSCLMGSFLKTAITKITKSGRLHRARNILVGTVLVLAIGAVAIANKINVFEQLNDFGFSNGQPVSTLQVLFAISLMLLGLIVPALIFAHRKSFIGSAFLVWIVFGLTFGPLALMWRSYSSYFAPGRFTVDDAVWIVLISFALNTVIGWLIPWIDQEDKTKEVVRGSAATNRQATRSPSRFSCLSFCLLAFVLLPGTGTFILTNWDFEDRSSILVALELEKVRVADVVRQLKDIDGITTTIDPSQVGIKASFSPRFDPAQGRRYFELISEILVSHERRIEISGMGPEVDVYAISGLVRTASFVDCEFTEEQLGEVMDGCYSVVFRNCRFVVGKSSLPSYSEIVVMELEPGQTANLFGCFGETSGQFSTTIYSYDLDKNDWRAILDRSTLTPVSVEIEESKQTEEWLRQLDSLEPTEDLKFFFTPESSTVLSESPGEKHLPNSFWRFALQNETVVTPVLEPLSTTFWRNLDYNLTNPFGRVYWNEQEFWDALFVAKNIDVYFPLDFDTFVFFSSIEKTGRAFHWCFDPPSYEPTPIRSLVLPVISLQTIASIGEMTELQKLSLDPSWLQNGATFDTSGSLVVVGLSDFKTLVKLQELYLPFGVRVKNWDFLNEMKDLRKIQFDAFRDEKFDSQPKFDPAIHSKLAEVATFHLPSPQQLLNLKKLPSLKRLTIKDQLSETGPGRLKLIQRMLGENVEVVVVPQNDSIPLPAEFVEHLERVRKLVRKRYLDPKKDEPKSPNDKEVEGIHDSAADDDSGCILSSCLD